MNWTAKDARRSRIYTTALLEAVDNGVVDRDTLINDLLGWLSESEVEAFVRANDMLEAVNMAEEDEDEEYDGQPDEAQEWESFDPDC
jgi:hypothetical protein